MVGLILKRIKSYETDTGRKSYKILVIQYIQTNINYASHTHHLPLTRLAVRYKLLWTPKFFPYEP